MLSNQASYEEICMLQTGSNSAAVIVGKKTLEIACLLFALPAVRLNMTVIREKRRAFEDASTEVFPLRLACLKYTRGEFPLPGFVVTRRRLC